MSTNGPLSSCITDGLAAHLAPSWHRSPAPATRSRHSACVVCWRCLGGPINHVSAAPRGRLWGLGHARCARAAHVVADGASTLAAAQDEHWLRCGQRYSGYDPAVAARQAAAHSAHSPRSRRRCTVLAAATIATVLYFSGPSRGGEPSSSPRPGPRPRPPVPFQFWNGLVNDASWFTFLDVNANRSFDVCAGAGRPPLRGPSPPPLPQPTFPLHPYGGPAAA